MAKSRTDLQRTIDGILTEYYNNNKNVQNFMAEMAEDLDKNIRSNLSAAVRFFVKGGTALKILQKNLSGDWSDWDTQLLINPTLDAKRWYDVYLKIQNLLEEFLGKQSKKWGDLVQKTLELQNLRQKDALTQNLKTKLTSRSKNSSKFTKVEKFLLQQLNADNMQIEIVSESNSTTSSLNKVIHPVQVYDNVTTVFRGMSEREREVEMDKLYPSNNEV